MKNLNFQINNFFNVMILNILLFFVIFLNFPFVCIINIFLIITFICNDYLRFAIVATTI